MVARIEQWDTYLWFIHMITTKFLDLLIIREVDAKRERGGGVWKEIERDFIQHHTYLA